MVFMIEQSLSDFEKSSSPPERHMLRNVPAYPDSEPSFYAHDKNTDMALAVATSSSTPESVKAFYDAHMVAKGWKTAPEAYLATPGSDTGHPGPLPLRGFNIYLKGAALCFVLATETADRGETTISLIHKQMKMD